jgi:hypothetical protein
MKEVKREKQLVSFRAWSDEYKAFKALCHEWRTTPTAKLNEFMREMVEKHNKEEKR